MKLINKVTGVIVGIVVIAILIGTIGIAINFGRVFVGCSKYKEACKVAIEKVEKGYSTTIEEIREGKE